MKCSNCNKRVTHFTYYRCTKADCNFNDIFCYNCILIHNQNEVLR